MKDRLSQLKDRAESLAQRIRSHNADPPPARQQETERETTREEVLAHDMQRLSLTDDCEKVLLPELQRRIKWLDMQIQSLDGTPLQRAIGARGWAVQLHDDFMRWRGQPERTLAGDAHAG